MAYASTIFPVKNALFELLRDWAWPDPAPTVTWGPPTRLDETGFDLVYLGTVEDIDDNPPGLGARRDETFTVPVYVDVHRQGDDERDTERLAWDHAGEVRQLLTENTTLLGATVRLPNRRLTVTTAPAGPQTWRTQIVIRVEATGLVHNH